MDEQCNRYSIRGQKGIENNEYSDFKVFIVCPEKYYEQNTEAKKYDYHVFYEECLKYFSGCWCSILCQLYWPFCWILRGQQITNIWGHGWC